MSVSAGWFRRRSRRASLLGSAAATAALRPDGSPTPRSGCAWTRWPVQVYFADPHSPWHPLGHRRPIRQSSPAGGGIAPQLTRDRRRCPPDPAGDLTHADTLSFKQRDLLTLNERQISTR